MKPQRYTIPVLKKLVTRGSNIKLLEWLTGYGEFFYQKGWNDALDHVAKRSDSSGVGGEPEGSEPSPSNGPDASNPDSGVGSTATGLPAENDTKLVESGSGD